MTVFFRQFAFCFWEKPSQFRLRCTVHLDVKKFGLEEKKPLALTEVPEQI